MQSLLLAQPNLYKMCVLFEDRTDSTRNANSLRLIFFLKTYSLTTRLIAMFMQRQ